MSELVTSLFAKARDWVKGHPKLTALALAYLLYRATRRKKDYRGKIVLITGAGNGLGRLMAVKFALLGARVVMWDINAKGLDAVAQEILTAFAKRSASASGTAGALPPPAGDSKDSGAGYGGSAANGGVVHGSNNNLYTYTCDVSDPKAVNAVADRVKSEVGDVDCLINNAGVVSGRFVDEISDEAIRRTFGVNTLALFWTTRAFLPGMMKKKAGHICNVASAAGLVGISKMTDYSASKFAAVGMTESLRNELKHRGFAAIKTTCICPYYINTGMFAGVPSNPLLPILDENYVVSRIVDAIRYEQEVVLLPALVNLLAPFRLLPVSLFDWIGNVLRLNTTMDTFHGRSIDPPKPAASTATAAAQQ